MNEAIKHKIKVKTETPIKTLTESCIGTVDIKYTDDGIEIILNLNCKSVKMNAMMLPIIIPVIAKNIPW